MKIKPRPTAKRVVALRITAPEFRPDPQTEKNIPLLSYIDAGSNQRHKDTTKALFLYAAGSVEEGEVSDGLDRLLHHKFVVHLDEKDRAVGVDVIPSRLYRSGVIPTSQDGVKNLFVQYLADGAVARVVKRPPNFRFENSAAIIQELDKLIAAGKQISVNMRLGALGRVVGVTDDTVEIRMIAPPRKVQGVPSGALDDLVEDDDEPTDTE